MSTNPLPHLHQFKVWGEHFILNIPSSRFYRINDMMAQIVGLLREGKTIEKIIEVLTPRFPSEEIAKNLSTLEKIGLLSNSNGKEESFYPPKTHPLDTLDLQVSHRCNLNCRYCYARGGNFGKPDRLMTVETAKKAIDFFLEQSDGKKTLGIVYDGGEPLINFNVIKEATLYAREKVKGLEKAFYFGIGTNATLVTGEIAEFFAEHKISPQISLDGAQHIHDELRSFKNGKSSYRRMMAGVGIFNEKEVKLASRITITPRNLNLKDNVELLYNLGVIRIAAFPATGIPGKYALDASELNTLKEEYDKTAEFFLGTLFNTGRYVCFANFTDNLKNLHKAKILHYGCGSARKFISIDPYEEIYPCHRLVGNKKFQLGNLQRGIDYEKRRIFLENHVEGREKCRNCWAKYLCGGGCLAEADYAHGDISIPYDVSCEIFKYEKELSMMIYAKIHSRDKFLLEKIP
jgi:uncharacterized protein